MAPPDGNATRPETLERDVGQNADDGSQQELASIFAELKTLQK